jgi:hypothetical protein
LPYQFSDFALDTGQTRAASRRWPAMAETYADALRAAGMPE